MAIKKFFSISELIDYFAIEDINRAPAALVQRKLLWLNQHYLKTNNRDEVAKLQWQMEKLGVNIANGPTLTFAIQCDRTNLTP